MFRARRFKSNVDGASAVEFAIVFPVLAAIFMAIVEFSLLLHAHNSALNATREVVRRLATNSIDAAAVDGAVKARLPSWVVGAASVRVTNNATSVPDVNVVTVSVTFPATAAAASGMFDWLLKERMIENSSSMQQERSP